MYAWTNDTRYGSGVNNILSSKKILKGLDLESSVEFFCGDFNKKHLQEADLITNSGFLRPLDKQKLSLLKKEAVISLMYEAWELRESDIDVNYVHKTGVKLAGVWEDHPDLSVFRHVGVLGVKMALEAGYEIYGNDIVVWSNDNFGTLIEREFKSLGARSVKLTTSFDVLSKGFENVDFVFICDYDESREYGKEQFFDIEKLLSLNASFGVVHLFGKFSYESWKSRLEVIYPERDGHESRMTFTLGHVGLNPIINLQVGGFKVGEELLKGEYSSLTQLIEEV